MNSYYVYLLTDPRNNNSVFYCGKGKGDRWKSHLGHWSGNGKNNPTENKIKKIKGAGLEPGVIFLHKDIIDEELAYELETKYIAENFYSLTNLKIDANPPSRKGQPAWNKGKKMPEQSVEQGRLKRIGVRKNFKNKEEWRKNVSKSLAGNKHPMFGKSAVNCKSVLEITTGKKFDSLSIAATELGLKQGDISNCLAGRQKSTKGYRFQFNKDDS
jgi:hypothetical protein